MANGWAKALGAFLIAYSVVKCGEGGGCSCHRDDHDKRHKTEQNYNPCPTPQVIVQPIYIEKPPAQAKSSGSNQKSSIDTQQDNRISELEKIAQEKKEEPKKEEITAQNSTPIDNYQQYSNERKRLNLRNECDRNSMMVNGRAFYTNLYGTMFFNGPSRGGMLSFSRMIGPNQYTPMYIPQTQFFRYIQSVEVDANNYYYITFKQSTRPNVWNRAMNNEFMFQPGWVPR